jgi:hypothetical protein
MVSQINDGNKLKKLISCKNYDEICDLHDQVIVYLRKLQDEQNEKLKLLSNSAGVKLNIVIKGTEQIIPLLTHDEFEQESDEMNNCLAYSSYFQDCVRGELAVYRVLHPQRCTLSVELTPEIKISELELKDNLKPLPSTYEYVKEWLKSNMGNNK